MRALDSRIEDRWRVLLALVVAALSIPLLLLTDFGSTVGADDDPITMAPSPTTAPDASTVAPSSSSSTTTVAPEVTTTAPESEAVVAEIVVDPAPAPNTTAPSSTTPPATQAPSTSAAPSTTDAPPSTEAPPTTVPPDTSVPKLVEIEEPGTPPTTVPPTTEPPDTGSRPAVTPIAGKAGDPTADQWWQLRECESNNNYQSVNPSGKFRGAYQFSRATWDWVAASYFPSLVGEDPAAALPANQDAMALALTRKQAPSAAWPECSWVAGIA